MAQKKNGNLTTAEKRLLLEWEVSDLKILRQCKLLEMARSTAYYQLQGATDEEIELMNLIDEQYTKTPFYGSRKMTHHLRNSGYNVNRKRIQRLMKKLGLEAIYCKPSTSKPNPNHKKFPYLLRNIKIVKPNQVWCTDITYIRLNQGFIYLVAVMDWFSRYVLSWEISVTLDVQFCLEALESALRFGTCEIFNSDQGSQFTSNIFTNTLENANIDISMDGRGRCFDNIFIERLWRSLKYDEVYIKDYKTVGEAIKGIDWYFNLYNNERPHASLKNKTPRDIYFKG